MMIRAVNGRLQRLTTTINPCKCPTKGEPSHWIQKSRFSIGTIIPPSSAIADYQEIMLQPLDYPAPFRGEERGTKLYAHPGDYKKSKFPIKPEVFLFKGAGSRARLFLRTSIRINKTSATDAPMFTNATFFVDTSACAELTVCDDLYDLMSPRIVQHFEYDFITVNISNKEFKYVVSTALSDVHKSANIIGLPTFFSMGYKFKACDIRDLPMGEHRIVKDVVETQPFDYL